MGLFLLENEASLLLKSKMRGRELEQFRTEMKFQLIHGLINAHFYIANYFLHDYMKLQIKWVVMFLVT